MKIGELKKEMDARFEQVDARFQQVDARFDELKAEIKADGETTRRHFDVVAEQFREFTKVLADGIARNTERLDDHERRITTIESSPS
jgi:transcription termination factor NusB